MARGIGSPRNHSRPHRLDGPGGCPLFLEGDPGAQAIAARIVEEADIERRSDQRLLRDFLVQEVACPSLEAEIVDRVADPEIERRIAFLPVGKPAASAV